MKEFKILVGLTEGNMTEVTLASITRLKGFLTVKSCKKVLHASLKNDPTPETFSIKSINRVGIPFPTKFIEIVPLS